MIVHKIDISGQVGSDFASWHASQVWGFFFKLVEGDRWDTHGLHHLLCDWGQFRDRFRQWQDIIWHAYENGGTHCNEDTPSNRDGFRWNMYFPFYTVRTDNENKVIIIERHDEHPTQG